MIGGNGLHVALGAAPGPSAPEPEIRRYVGALAKAGLHVMFCVPNGKAPAELRPPATIAKADREYRAELAAAGRTGCERMSAPAGLHLATDDTKVLNRFLKRYREPVAKGGFGEDAAVNLAVEVGRSRLIVVDCDTHDEIRAFLQDATGSPDAMIPPTVRSPGVYDAATDEWKHRDGGHFWFTLPEGVDLPRSSGHMKRTVTLDAGTEHEREVAYALMWADRYVLIPPSVRKEGPYRLAGEVYDADGTPLIPWITAHERQRESNRRAAEQRRAERAASRDDTDFHDAVSTWAEGTEWSDLLEPLGWSPYSVDTSCGCAVWTAPGSHASGKSATCHDSGCSLGRYTTENAPMHIWTDNPGDPFAEWIGDGNSTTISKLQVAALAMYDGDMRAAVSGLGLSVVSDRDDLTDSLERLDSGLALDLGDTFDLPPLVDTPAEVTTADPLVPVTDTAPSTPIEPGSSSTSEELAAEIVAPEMSTEDTAAAFDSIITASGAFPLSIRPFGEWRHEPAPEWDLHGLIERGSLCSIIGPPGVGKSAVAVGILAHMVVGKDWMGRKTIKQRALYLPGEGLSGAVARLRVWEDAHELHGALDEHLWISDQILPARTDPKHWTMLADFIRDNGIGIVVFDTFARMTAGVDENDAKDVGLVVRKLDQVRRATGATVVVVHHTKKSDPSSSRGSSALTGAVDSELVIEAYDAETKPTNDNGNPIAGKAIRLRPTKIKNGADGDEASVELLLRGWEDTGALRPDSPTVPTAALVVSGSGKIEPYLFDVASVVELVRPDSPVRTALRIIDHLARHAAQLGASRPDLARDVDPDEYTKTRRGDTAAARKYWRSAIDTAVDIAVAAGVLESSESSSARWIPVAGLTTSEAKSRLDLELSKRTGLIDLDDALSEMDGTMRAAGGASWPT